MARNDDNNQGGSQGRGDDNRGDSGRGSNTPQDR